MRTLTLLVAVAGWTAVGWAGTIELRTARITVADPANRSQTLAAEELETHLRLIAGARTPSPDGFRIAIGSASPGGGVAADWESRGVATERALYLWGDDSSEGKQRYGSLFAVYGFLEQVLGVRWVRPGDDGIVAAARAQIELPAAWDYRYRPPLEKCEIRVGAMPKSVKRTPVQMKTYDDEVTPKELRQTHHDDVSTYRAFRRWTLRMCHETRAPFAYGHAFTKWNDRFFLTGTHPEYLAMWDNGRRGTRKQDKGKYIHLCYSNPDVLDQIVRDWCEKGTNAYLNACASDSQTTHCRCEGCRALDGDVPGEDFLKDKSDRQVWLWNRLIEKARAIRPDVKVIGYIYANYRQPPRRWRLEYPDHFIGGIVPSLYDDSCKLIRGWQEKGLKAYFVRPNYLCSKSAMPRGVERYLFEDFKANLALGMIGVDEDNYRRNLSPVVAFEFYALARVMKDPTLTFDEVSREFLSQYGAAAPEMSEYHARVRTRGEAARLRQMENLEVRQALDDSQNAKAGFAGHTPADLAGDLKVVDRALARTDLTPLARRRVTEVRVMIEHAALTLAFLTAAESDETAFLAAAARLRAFRLAHRGEMREDWQMLFSDKRLERPLWLRVREIERKKG